MSARSLVLPFFALLAGCESLSQSLGRYNPACPNPTLEQCGNPPSDDLGGDLHVIPVVYDLAGFTDAAGLCISAAADCKDPALPVCVPGPQGTPTCSACKSDAECRGIGDPARVACDAPSGKCVPCNSQTDCAGGLACVAHQCVPCATNAQCDASAVCDVISPTTAEAASAIPQGPRGPGRRGDGRCADPSTVLFVSNQPGSCSPTGGATLSAPLCWTNINDAVAKGKKVIRLLPSATAYGAITLDAALATTYTLVGPANEGGTAKLGAVSVRNKASAVIDGFDITGAGVTDGVSCSGVGLLLTRSRVLGVAGTGVSVSGCAISMDRVQVSGSGKGGVVLASSPRFSITNSFITGNNIDLSEAAVVISNDSDSTGTFQYNTVVGNVSSGAGGMNCGMVARAVEDSIVFGNTRPSGTQFFGSCMLGSSTAVGVTETRAGGYKAADPAFVSPATGDYRLQTTNQCCIDKGLTRAAKTDHFGVSRPLGAAPDVGAHEAK